MALVQLFFPYSRAPLDVVLDVFLLEVSPAVEKTKSHARYVGRRFFDVPVEGGTYGLPVDNLAVAQTNLLTIDLRG